MLTRLQAPLRALLMRLEAAFNRAFGERLNPLYHLGACSFFLFWVVAATGLSLALNSWALTLNGLGNQYYAAASRSMITSWSNFFFASFDPGGYISVDKPPVFLWIDAVSARLFGINTWSLLLPSAIAGAAAVALLYRIVERHFGRAAAIIAGLCGRVIGRTGAHLVTIAAVGVSCALSIHVLKQVVDIGIAVCRASASVPASGRT